MDNRKESPKHRAAHARVVALAEASDRWGIPVFCLWEFVRIAMHPSLFDPPYSADKACEALTRLLASPTVVVPYSGYDYPVLLAEAILEAQATGNRVFDAQVAVLCRQCGVSRLITEDRNFDRFRNLSTERR